MVCSKNSSKSKSGTNRTDVFDGSNESLYHADEELYTRFPIHSPCQTNSDLRHVLPDLENTVESHKLAPLN